MEIEELRRLAAKEELSLNYIAKDEIISKILFKLQKFDNLILKGGTAINRVYIKNKRFSEDIDFDIISNEDLKHTLIKTKEIIKDLTDLEIGKPRIMKESIRYDLFFINPLNHKDRVMLEFKPIKSATEYSKRIINFGFVPHESALLNVYNIEELIKSKIECILTRFEGKDFFDLYYLLDSLNNSIKISKIKKEAILKRLDLDDEHLRLMANVINHYIPKNKRPNWVLFLEELKEKIKNRLS